MNTNRHPPPRRLRCGRAVCFCQLAGALLTAFVFLPAANIDCAVPADLTPSTALEAKSLEPWAESDYHHLFARAVLTTIPVELAVLFLVVRFWFKLPGEKLSSPLLWFAGVFASGGTLPWLWFVLPRVLPTYALLIVVGEVLVWAVEALFYVFVLRLGWKRAAILSLACNLVSYGVGLLCQ